MRTLLFPLVVLAACGGRKPPEGADPVTDSVADTDTDTDTDSDTDADTDSDTDADTDADTADTAVPTGPPIDTANPSFLLVINEILADAAVADANCDGVVAFDDDEFIEIVNAGGVAIDLSGATLSDLTGVRHAFPAGTVLDPLGAVVVFGGGTPTFDGSNPASWCVALPPDVLTQTSSTGQTGFNNSGDTLTLTGPAGTLLGTVTFGVEADAGISLNLDPELDPFGRWVLHDTLPGGDTGWSPGRRAGGEAFTETPTGSGTTGTGTVFFPTSVLINEINADPSLVDGDANCDGLIDTGDDEFLELYNPTGAVVDVSGWTITDDTGAVRHTFAPYTLIDVGGVLLVFGGGTPSFGSGQPQAWCVALPQGVKTVTASSGLLGMSFPTDTATLSDAAGVLMDTWTFGAEANADQSLVRDPELTGTTFVQHGSSLGANRTVSPGTRRDGTAL